MEIHYQMKWLTCNNYSIVWQRRITILGDFLSKFKVEVPKGVIHAVFLNSDTDAVI